MTPIRADPFQVNYRGTVHGPGDVFDAEGPLVAGWVRDSLGEGGQANRCG